MQVSRDYHTRSGKRAYASETPAGFEATCTGCGWTTTKPSLVAALAELVNHTTTCRA